MSALATANARTAPGRSRGAAHRPALQVVPRRRRTWPYLVVFALVAVAGVFGVLSLSALAAEAAFAARELESDIETLSLRYDELTAEVARLESPERVRAVATTELGMVRSEQPAFLVVDRPLEQRAGGGDAQPAATAVADPVKRALGAGS